VKEGEDERARWRVNAGEFQGRRCWFPISIVVSIGIEASSIDNWREVGGSFERVIGPGLWHESGLKVTFSSGWCHEPGLKGHGALVPAVR
jgi:hypothetical protein